MNVCPRSRRTSRIGASTTVHIIDIEFMHSQYYYYISIMHPAFSIYYTHYNATCQVIFLDETYYIIYIYI